MTYNEPMEPLDLGSLEPLVLGPPGQISAEEANAPILPDISCGKAAEYEGRLNDLSGGQLMLLLLHLGGSNHDSSCVTDKDQVSDTIRRLLNLV
jgi:hypothetical protein